MRKLIFLGITLIALVITGYGGYLTIENVSAQSNGPRGVIQPGFGTITKADVEAYVKTHEFVGGDTISGKPSTVKAIDFITSKEASHRLHDASIGLPDETIVIYIEREGPFSTSRLSRPYGAKMPVSRPIGVEIFNAQTGQLIMYSL